MPKPKLTALLLLVGVLGWGIYQTCCAVRPVEIGRSDVDKIAEQQFSEYLRSKTLSAAAFKREEIWFDDTVGVWNVVYRNIPGEKERIVSILVGKYGGVEMHAFGP